MVPLLAVAGARVVAWDSRSVLVGLNALTAILYLPAWPVGLFAAVTERWGLTAAATVLVLAQAAFLAPELEAREQAAAVPEGALRFRLFSANVYAGNREVAGIVDEIGASSPDVVFLQEATPAIVAGVDGTGVLDRLPHRVTVARTDPFAGLLASRWPLVDQDVVEVDGRPIIIRATAVTDQGPVRLYSVHVVAPVAGGREAWAREMNRVGEAIRSEEQPVVVAGDFNATWSNRPFRRLLDLGLTDAAAARGRALEMTWPRDRRLLPPLIRIDHVLTTRGLAVTRLRAGHGQGSDHRPLVADVARTLVGG